MQVVVTGAGTPLGQSMLRAIVARGALARGDGDPRPVRRIIAVDRTQPAALFLDGRIEYVRGDYEQPRFLARVMGMITDSIFHLSALGAGLRTGTQLEDLDTALLHSLDTTRTLLDACRFQTAPPKLVFASTVQASIDRASLHNRPMVSALPCASCCSWNVLVAALSTHAVCVFPAWSEIAPAPRASNSRRCSPTLPPDGRHPRQARR